MKSRFLLLACLLLVGSTYADLEATTKDGRKVLLNDNGLWQFVKEGDDEKAPKARLMLKIHETYRDSCRLGFEMTNNLGFPIRTAVLRFTAYKPGGVAFDTLSRGFSRIKPGEQQFQEIRFRGVTCEEIDKLQVNTARNCHIGELTKYNASAKTCLDLLRTEPSDFMTIYQAPTE